MPKLWLTLLPLHFPNLQTTSIALPLSLSTSISLSLSIPIVLYPSLSLSLSLSLSISLQSTFPSFKSISVTMQGSGRRPREKINSMVLYNTKNNEEAWVGQHFQVGDWVYMQPSAVGVHRVRGRHVLERHWKGRIVSFKTSNENGVVAVVQHVYSLSDIHLWPQRNALKFHCNCK